MKLLERIYGAYPNEPEALFALLCATDIEALAQIHGAPGSELNECRAFLRARHCPPALLYKVADIRRNVPLNEYDYSFADLKREYTREKGEKVRTVYRDSEGRPVVQKDRVYTYFADLVPEKMVMITVWFYADGTEAYRQKKTPEFKDKGRAKAMRFSRLGQNLIDVNDWLRSSEGGGLSNADFGALAGQMSPYLEAYRNGIITPLLAAVSSSDLVFLDGVKEGLTERLYVSD